MSTALKLGPFPVRGTAAEASAFRAAIGLSEGGDDLPLTFAMRWLVAPEILSALQAVVADPAGLVLVHESQSFEGTRRLKADVTYHFTLSARRETGPDRLCVDGVIADAAGLEQARMETVLRLVGAP